MAPLAELLAAERPNFVIIMADDLGYGDIGCYGSERIRTPHLDRLAVEGMWFTDFHSSGAVCSPTRAGLMTGRYQQRAGIPTVIFADPKRPTHSHGIQDREVTFAELLAGAGYKTAIFGKWHLGYYKRYNPVRHGFGQFRGYVSGNVDFISHVDQAGRLDWWRDDTIDDEPGYDALWSVSTERQIADGVTVRLTYAHEEANVPASLGSMDWSSSPLFTVPYGHPI
ncbi:MAG: sulfatase-like hydrolase/transferase [Canidatus Methanoxibalbensis ujae]|nr:sulfatase-like hydrolase/transferase [Candidatus Methanoxibalbensis ujae]